MFDVTNVRLGFATNSSSTHSVVLGPGKYKPGYQSIAEHDDVTSGEYGWDDFVLDTPGEKVSYLATLIAQSFRESEEFLRRAVMRELFPGLSDDFFHDVGYVDHQSAFNLGDPKLPGFRGRVMEALEFFRDDRVVVYGGNDNDPTPPPKGGVRLGQDGESLRIRRDGDHYVVFNTQTGAKVRMSPPGTTFKKATKPELVDLKITDHCIFGCQFCYQSSTPSGGHVDLYRVEGLLRALGVNGAGVFEVAIGGGEPTGHPQFPKIIEACVDEGIVPNFTTFSVDWLMDERKLAAAAMCGGVGVSVHSADQMWKWKKIRQALPLSVSVVAQHVYGTLDVRDTELLLLACRNETAPTLLLGFKNVGFGANMTQLGLPIPHDLTAVENGWTYLNGLPYRLSVDTAFIDRHPSFLAGIGADKVTLSPTEGAFSCYVDAVTGQMGPSSYCPPSDMSTLSKQDRFTPDVNAMTAEILKIFGTYPGQP